MVKFRSNCIFRMCLKVDSIFSAFLCSTACLHFKDLTNWCSVTFLEIWPCFRFDSDLSPHLDRNDVCLEGDVYLAVFSKDHWIWGSGRAVLETRSISYAVLTENVLVKPSSDVSCSSKALIWSHVNESLWAKLLPK